MSETISTKIGLDDATLTQMRAEAEAHRSQFIDPALLREAQALLPSVGVAWLERVIGHPVRSWQYLSNVELALAVNAAKMDAEHLRELAEQRRAAYLLADARREGEIAARARAARDAWEALRARLPVPVAVWHNWTARHVDGYEQGADHICVLEPFTVGRFHRDQNRPLCWTPARAHPLRYVSAVCGDGRRIPDCKACLRHAEKLAAQEG